MSDTEEESTFDREAEKEKLREQLRRDERNRRTTQHMSELLLKGATMTNKHCDTCGDPLFRYQGQEFCPTCSQREGESGATEGGSAVEGGDGSAERAETAAEAGGGSGVDRIESTGTPAGQAPRTTGRAAPSAGEPAQPATTTGPTDDVGGDVAEARASLVRTLASLARKAEATEDVGRARELLAAAREAAEALAAIDQLRG